jgi:hypothetical protein
MRQNQSFYWKVLQQIHSQPLVTEYKYIYDEVKWYE